MNNAFDYCKTPDAVSKEELINLVHQMLMQLEATAKHETLTLVDNRGVIAGGRSLMAKAGHVGFTP